MTVPAAVIAAPAVLAVYAYVGYPLVLAVVAMLRRGYPIARHRDEWPCITITVPAYNEERAIAATLDCLLATDYPADRRRILVVSDASTDRTDEIVRAYADRGVDLLRLAVRRGKTAAENAAARVVTTDIVVSTDASVRVLAGALKPLVRAFDDPTVGVASGRDVSARGSAAERPAGMGEMGVEGESGYVGYEMFVRSLETRVGSIIGASGSLYAFRRTVYDAEFPEALSRDFASVLVARAHGYRGVSVEDARCVVPRAASLRAEFRRKARTMARGLATLWYERALLNPGRYGVFAYMLFSHKVCRWLVYPLLVPATVMMVVLARHGGLAAVALGGLVVAAAAGAVAVWWPIRRPPPRVLALCGYVPVSTAAGVLAWAMVLGRRRIPTWEPTRRPT